MKWVIVLLAFSTLAVGGVIGWRATEKEPHRSKPAAKYQQPRGLCETSSGQQTHGTPLCP